MAAEGGQDGVVSGLQSPLAAVREGEYGGARIDQDEFVPGLLVPEVGRACRASGEDALHAGATRSRQQVKERLLARCRARTALP
jgi:hypothetical protein